MSDTFLHFSRRYFNRLEDNFASLLQIEMNNGKVKSIRMVVNFPDHLHRKSLGSESSESTKFILRFETKMF